MSDEQEPSQKPTQESTSGADAHSPSPKPARNINPIAQDSTLGIDTINAFDIVQSEQLMHQKQQQLAQEKYAQELHAQAQKLVKEESAPQTKIHYPDARNTVPEPQAPPRFLQNDSDIPIEQLTRAASKQASKSASRRDYSSAKKAATFGAVALSVVAIGTAFLFLPRLQSKNNSVLLATDAADMAMVDKLIKQKKLQQAVPLLDKIIERNPKLIEAFQARGKAYLGLGQYRLAADDLSTAIVANPRLIKAIMDRAASFYYLTEYDKSLADYDNVLTSDHSNAAALLGRAMCEERTHKNVEAIADLESAIKIQPKYAEAYDELGTVYANQNELENSLEAYTKSIDLNPKSAQTFFNRGNVFCKNNQAARSIADYSMAIELEPNRPEFLNNRGYIFLQDGSFEKAISDFTTAVLLDPNYDRAKQNLILARSHTKAAKP